MVILFYTGKCSCNFLHWIIAIEHLNFKLLMCINVSWFLFRFASVSKEESKASACTRDGISHLFSR